MSAALDNPIFGNADKGSLTSCGFGGVPSIRFNTSLRRLSSKLSAIDATISAIRFGTFYPRGVPLFHRKLVAPQPLSKVRSNANFRFAADALEKQPTFNTIIAHIIHIGSWVESRCSAILIELLKADPKTGMAMYQALESAEAKRAALAGAASVALSEPDYLLFSACMKAIKPARDARNRFAHGVWGTSEELPDAILLADPKDFLRFEVGVAEANAKMASEKKFIVPDKIDTSRIQVWTKISFDKARERATEALETINCLELGLYYSGPGISAQTRTQLLRWPLVSQALQGSSPKNNPATHG